MLLCCFFFFLIADKQLTAAGRHGIVKGTADINQHRYFKNALTLFKMELKKCIALRKKLCFCFHRKQKAVDLFKFDRD